MDAVQLIFSNRNGNVHGLLRGSSRVVVDLSAIDVFCCRVIPGQDLKCDEGKDESEFVVEGTGTSKHNGNRFDDLFVGGNDVVDREGLVDGRCGFN